jgi:hypothetical protein
MSFLKKLCMTLWFLATVFAAAALGLTLYGPYVIQARRLFANTYYSYAVQICLAISLIGALIMWISALAKRKGPNALVIDEDEGTLTVTRDAIASQARYLTEEDGSCEATRVTVTEGKQGDVNVSITLRPHYSLSVVTRGPELQEKLKEGLTQLCGDKIGLLNIEFLAPEEPDQIKEDDTSDAIKGEITAGTTTESESAPESSDTADKDNRSGDDSDEDEDNGETITYQPASDGDGVTIALNRAKKSQEESHEQ